MTLTRTISLLSLEGFWDGMEEDFSSEPLCVPDDPLHEIEWHPTILNCYISTTQSLQLKPPKRAAISAAPSAGRRPEKPRKKSQYFALTQERPAVAPPDCRLLKKPRTKRSGNRRRASDPLLTSPPSDDLRWGDDDDEYYGVRKRCSYCSIDNTPQWRSGPAGPGTLCNACGIRYKAGRLSDKI